VTKDEPRDLGASVRSRLLALAKARGEDFTFILTRYGLERLLYRLGRSPHAKDFVLKGAMLFPLWSGNPHRSTMDLDLLGFGSPDLDRLVRNFREVVNIPISDGLEFLPATVHAAPIREDAVYDGFRVNLEARLAAARIHLQVDVGFGDAVIPTPREVAYPTLLDSPAPVLRAYPREAVVAEKLHAMVDLGLANSRMKDFFDLWFLATTFSFERAVLAAAIRSTFDCRKTAIPEAPPLALTSEFSNDQKKRVQWAAFVKKSRLAEPSLDLNDVVAVLNRFLWPVLVALNKGEGGDKLWTIGDGWR
jgi:predicted nucleotidyltransferase component of viral defense system